MSQADLHELARLQTRSTVSGRVDEQELRVLDLPGQRIFPQRACKFSFGWQPTAASYKAVGCILGVLVILRVESQG